MIPLTKVVDIQDDLFALLDEAKERWNGATVQIELDISADGMLYITATPYREE